AVAIVHPALDKSYPNQDSAGAMVAFKLAWAIANEFNAGRKLQPTLRDFMINATSLAAMGTVADVMDLRGENRILTSYGLKSLPHCKISGMQCLIETAGLSGKGLDSFHIGFRLAPMLNAAGRMGHARLAVELLTSDNPIRSMQIAEYLKGQNSERQKCEKKIFKEACEMIVRRGLNHPDHKSIVIAAENWHVGVIGVVASRIAEKFFRPAIIIQLPKPAASDSPSSDAPGNIAQGSGRSREGFDLLAAINASSRHLATFGGHKMAAGLTLEADKVSIFAKEFEDYARGNLKTDDCVPKLNIDAVTQLSQINKHFVNELHLLAPFGQGNPKPVFAAKGVRLASPPRRVGAKGDHLQIAVTDNTNTIRCIAFGMGKLEKKLLEHDFFNIAYEADINTYNGSSNIQLVLTDIQFE
ncbi:MAG: single-stranded-DNA-specific exonuclease RecJ, partial [Planctomycetota bacterium]